MSKKHFYSMIILVVCALIVGVAAVSAAPSEQCLYKTGVMNWGNIIPSTCAPVYTAPSAACCTTCSRAEFVKDVTIPDGSYVAPGTRFTKTWRIRNAGSTTWGGGTTLVFYGGSQLGAPASVALPYAVVPGQYVNVSVSLVAPTTPGTYQANWMFKAPDGTLFGVGCNGQVPIWVNFSTIKNNCYCVNTYNCNCGNPCQTAGTCGNPCQTGGNCWYNPKTQYPTVVNRNPYCNNKIRSVNDITIADGTEMVGNNTFRKTWTMKNGGTCVWNEGYSLIFTGGDAMNGPQSVQMPRKVYPGETVQISIDLKSPTTPGIYRGYYMLKDNLGYTFGFGSYANKAFWADIKVVDALAEEKPTAEPPAPTPAAPVTPSNPTNPTSPTATPALEADGVESPLIIDEGTDYNPVDNPLEPDEMKSIAHNECGAQHIEINFVGPDTYNIDWFVTNDGAATWSPDKYKVINAGTSENLALVGNDVKLPLTKPGEQAMISIVARVRDLTSTADKWMKFYINDGIESFCEVYFPISGN